MQPSALHPSAISAGSSVTAVASQPQHEARRTVRTSSEWGDRAWAVVGFAARLSLRPRTRGCEGHRRLTDRGARDRRPSVSGLYNVLFSCELAWRGPCDSTDRDKVDRQLQNVVICRLQLASVWSRNSSIVSLSFAKMTGGVSSEDRSPRAIARPTATLGFNRSYIT